MNKLIESMENGGYSSVRELEEDLAKDLVSVSSVLIEINICLTSNQRYRARIMKDIFDRGYWIYTTTSDSDYFALEYYENYEQAINVICKIIKSKEGDSD